MAAHQAPPPLGFFRQEYWMGCHFLLQYMKAKSESEVAQSCPTLSDPVDCSPPGFSVREIFQARVLEWGAIAFFNGEALTLQNSLISPRSRFAVSFLKIFYIDKHTICIWAFFLYFFFSFQSACLLFLYLVRVTEGSTSSNMLQETETTCILRYYTAP